MSSEIKINKCENSAEIINLLEKIKELYLIDNNNDENSYSLKTNKGTECEDLIEVLIYHLYKNTNLKDFIKENKTFMLSNHAFEALLGEVYKNGSLEKLFSELKNKLFNLESKDRHFLIPLNLNLKNDESKKIFENLSTVFDFEICNPKEIEKISSTIKDDEEKKFSKLKKYNVILKKQCSTKTSYFAYKEILFNLESFLGFLTYVNISSQRKNYFGNIEDYSFIEFKYGDLIEYDPKPIFYGNFQLNDEKIDLFQHKNTIKSLKEMMGLYNEIKSKSLKNVIAKSFRNYYLASIETDLDYSFFKYWITLEIIIKSYKKKTDEEIIKIVKTLLSKEGYNIDIADFIHKSRNEFVHKGESISENDRNLIKIIVDKFIYNLLLNIGKLENKSQFDHYLSTFSMNDKDRKNLANVFEMFNNNEFVF
jgi:hypothetical protein